MTVLATEAAEKTLGQRVKARAGEETRSRVKAAPGQYRRAASGSVVPGGDKYQKAILAEFLVALGVVAFVPLATGGPEGKTSPSPYEVGDVVQLAAIAVTYFILALVPGRGSRWAAWIGLLVLLGIMYRKMGTGELTAAISGIHPGSGPSDETL